MKHLTTWLTVGLLCAAISSTLADDEDGFVSLFDGKTLDGWVGAKDSYEVEDGKIVCVQGTAGNLLTEKEYSDFVLRYDFRLTPGANNGLAIRSPLRERGNLHLEGIEIQILDDTAEKYKELQPYQYCGSVYGVVPAERGHLKPVGEWNTQEVIVRGDEITINMNGHTIVRANLAEAKPIDGQEHPGLARKRGHIGFLGHGDRVELRNIRIKDLSDAER